MKSEVDVEKWLAHLFSEMIRRGVDSDEHIHFHDSPLGDQPSPTLQQLHGAHLGWVGEFLTPLLQEHLTQILGDYEKREK